MSNSLMIPVHEKRICLDNEGKPTWLTRIKIKLCFFNIIKYFIYSHVSFYWMTGIRPNK